jgi:signal peptidase I
MLKKLLLILLALGALCIVGSVVTAFVLFRVVTVPTGAMANTIIPGDRVLVTRSVGEVKRGDVVVFKFPKDQQVLYVKRVIGMPGDEVWLEGMKVFINAVELPEQRVMVSFDGASQYSALTEVRAEPPGSNAHYCVYYDAAQAESGEGSMTQGMKYGVSNPVKVPADSYFVLGDSRDNSLDSRYWGFVPRELIVGKAVMILSSTHPRGETQDREMRSKRAMTPIK